MGRYDEALRELDKAMELGYHQHKPCIIRLSCTSSSDNTVMLTGLAPDHYGYLLEWRKQSDRELLRSSKESLIGQVW